MIYYIKYRCFYGVLMYFAYVLKVPFNSIGVLLYIVYLLNVSLNSCLMYLLFIALLHTDKGFPKVQLCLLFFVS